MEEERAADYAPNQDVQPEREAVESRPERDVRETRAEREAGRPALQPVRESSDGGLMEYRHRFDELQAQFIEEPRAAVEKAEKLVDEAVNTMLTSMRERMKTIHTGYDGDQSDTERLRLAMRGYREMMDSLLDRSAA